MWLRLRRHHDGADHHHPHHPEHEQFVGAGEDDAEDVAAERADDIQHDHAEKAGDRARARTTDVTGCTVGAVSLGRWPASADITPPP